MSDHNPQPRVRRPSRCRPKLAAGALLAVGAVVLAAGPRGMARAQDAAPPGAGSREPSDPPPQQPEQSPAEPSAEAEDEQGVKVAEGVEAEMRQSFAQLADSDPAVREAAHARLMGLDRRYLPALQKLVERSRPIPPSQAAVLRQIVTHVYLAGEPYASNANMGFLGVRMLDADVSLQAPRQVDPDIDPEEAEVLLSTQKGVVITERMPGFVGNRALLDGDVIVGLSDRPDFRFRGGEDFSFAVRQVGAGRTVRFIVLRRGRLTQVAVTLDPRPDAAEIPGQAPMSDLLNRRRQKAETYWNETFGPLLKERVS